MKIIGDSFVGVISRSVYLIKPSSVIKKYSFGNPFIPGNNSKSINLVINKGYSTKRVGKELVKFNIINNDKIFVIIKKLFFSNYILKAGEFNIPPHATLTEVLKILNKGDVVIHKLIILEGMTTQEILADILVNKTP